MLGALRKEPPTPLDPPQPHDPAGVAVMLREIGTALLEVHQPTPLVSGRLAEIAARYTSEPVQVVVLPTVLMVQVGSIGYEVGRSLTTSLQLDMAARIDEIAGRAAAGSISPAEAIEEIGRARTLQPRFGPIVTTVGYALATLGFGMLVHPTWAALPGYLFLGLVVGAIVQIGRPFPSLNPVLPTLSAMVVTVLATWFVADTAHDGLLQVITPALVALLPGISLTISAMELAGSQVISGASRLVAALAPLALLVFGVAQGLHFAHRLHPLAPPALMGGWSLYVAIVVVAVGLYVYLSAPPASLLWLIAAIAVAVVAQALAVTGSAVLSIALGTLVGWSIFSTVDARRARRVSAASGSR